PYHVVIAVRPFTDAEWDEVLDAIAAKAAHAAALLDGELLPEIVDDGDLLPGPGDLVPNCSCPDWADPCKHAASVCYLTADLPDDDPFVLFTIRGRNRNEVLRAIRARRRTGGSATAAASARKRVAEAAPATVSAKAAYATASAI